MAFFLPCIAAIMLSTYAMDTDIYTFEDLMTETSYVWIDLSEKERETLGFYKSLFLRNNILLPESEAIQRIPKVLHFIWLGEHPFPEASKKNLISWQNNHPDWVMKYWTDKPEREVPLPGMHLCSVADIPFSKAGHYFFKTKNYGEQSDLLRYEILFHEGGLYVDHDIECFHSFNPLIFQYDFFGYLEAPTAYPLINSKIRLNNGLIAFKPGHPILSRVMDRICEVWDEVEGEYPGEDKVNEISRTMKRTFNSFTYAVRSAIDQPGNRDIVFPASFGCPIYGFDSPEVINPLIKKKLIYARHDHAGAWILSRPLTKLFKTIRLAGRVALLAGLVCLGFLLGRWRRKRPYSGHFTTLPK